MDESMALLETRWGCALMHAEMFAPCVLLAALEVCVRLANCQQVLRQRMEEVKEQRSEDTTATTD
jgi:hypothetical protein